MGRYFFDPHVGDRKARTPKELRATVLIARIGHPAITVWLAAGLEEAAREVWQESHSALPKA